MQQVIQDRVYRRIRQFYDNARLKYPNTYSRANADRDIDKVHDELYKVGTQLCTRNYTIISRWNGYLVDYSTKVKWYFAYRIEDDVIYVEDAENYRNMSDWANIYLFQ
jgi:hypothetical protein